MVLETQAGFQAWHGLNGDTRNLGGPAASRGYLEYADRMGSSPEESRSAVGSRTR